MSEDVTLALRGPAAPPRANGELVFEAPWESRAFGVTMALCQDGVFEWQEFRGRLIAEIGGWEAAPEPKPAWSYYACWLNALEDLLSAKGLVPAAALHERVAELAARPHGHDHHHA